MIASSHAAFARAVARPESNKLIAAADFRSIGMLLDEDRAAEAMSIPTPQVLSFDLTQVKRNLDGAMYFSLDEEEEPLAKEHLGPAYRDVISFLRGIELESGLKLFNWFVHSSSEQYHALAGGMYHPDKNEHRRGITLSSSVVDLGTQYLDGEMTRKQYDAMISIQESGAPWGTLSEAEEEAERAAKRKAFQAVIQEAGVTEKNVQPGQTLVFSDDFLHTAPAKPGTRVSIFGRFERR